MMRLYVYDGGAILARKRFRAYKIQGDDFMDTAYLLNRRGQKIAYVVCEGTNESLPTVMFLGGFKSDMQGTKAMFLQEVCKARGQAFVRFDYTGHGLSEGAFTDGTIGAWRDDARDILDKIVHGDVILVGSSMGGWISLLLLREFEERVRGLIGIAAAPDFTRDIEAQLSEQQHAALLRDGRLEEPNDYGDDPYVFTKALIDDGRENSLLHVQHDSARPMILLQGKQDADVPWEKALRIQQAFPRAECEIVFIDDGDHRLSRESDLALLDRAVCELSGL